MVALLKNKKWDSNKTQMSTTELTTSPTLYKIMKLSSTNLKLMSIGSI